MRHRVRLAAPTGAGVQVPFEPDFMLVINPTVYTMYIRVGGNDGPSTIDAADEYVTPAGHRVFPVSGAGVNYGFSFGAPQISFSPESLPTVRADVEFFAGENVPQMGTLPVTNSGITPTDKVLAFTDSPFSYNNGSVDVAIGSDVRGVSVVHTARANYLFRCVGLQSGIVYYNGFSPQTNGQSFAFPVVAGRDTSLRCTVTFAGSEADFFPKLYGQRQAPQGVLDGRGFLSVATPRGAGALWTPIQLYTPGSYSSLAPIMTGSNRGVRVYIKVTFVGVNATLQFVPVSVSVGSAFTIAPFNPALITAPAIYSFDIYPGCREAANVSGYATYLGGFSGMVASNFTVQWSVTNANVTFGLDYELLP